MSPSELSQEYSGIKRILHINLLILCLVFFWDIYGLGAPLTINFIIIKTVFGLMPYLFLQLHKIKTLRNFATVLIMICFFSYCYYHMVFIHYSYFTSFFQYSMVGALIFRFGKLHFLASYLAGLVLLVLATYSLKEVPVERNFQSEVLSTSIPIWFFSIAWYFKIIKVKEKFEKQERAFSEMGKTSSFLMHEIRGPFHRLEHAHNDEKERVDEIMQIKSILKISNAIFHTDTSIELQEKLELGPLIDNVMRPYRQNFIHLNIVIEKNVEKFTFTTHQTLASILINNIIKNAMEYLMSYSEERALKIQGVRENEYYQLSISNPIKLVDKKHFKQMFEPLYSSKASGVNQGLGLFICQKIAKLLSIELESRHKDDRIYFEMKLPLK